MEIIPAGGGEHQTGDANEVAKWPPAQQQRSDSERGEPVASYPHLSDEDDEDDEEESSPMKTLFPALGARMYIYIFT